ncbi:MAG: protein-methionine-sulfoxide reductase catalytic subunit MsrP [Verrucomicrobiales bacterium]
MKIFAGTILDFTPSYVMAHIIKRSGWHIPEKFVTPEKVYQNRRLFLKQMGFLGSALTAGIIGCGKPESHAQEALEQTNVAGKVAAPKYPFKRNPEFNPAWDISEEKYATTYNNFYELTTSKTRVVKLVDKFVIDPWSIDIGGLVEKPMKVDVNELLAMMPVEERVYRFRCVEAWSMIVPWTGFPLSALLAKVSPKAEARFVKFQTFYRPEQAPGFADTNYPWPYTEGLRLDEAMNPLTLVTTGIYGKPLPKQNGAPVRLVVPWKYGYKSIKSIVKIELVAEQPKTLWESLAPHEYPFESNVNPKVPHPRWSQAYERLIDTGDRAATLPYNGYGKFVADLYKA